jgi:elongation factor P hydroxylase
VAHWCIAGDARRQQVDFGYWYAPQGRGPEQQRAFEAVEVKPQALEWYLSLACGYRFRVSVDNLDAATGQLPDTKQFRARLVEQALSWQRSGLPSRAQSFYLALCQEFGTDKEPLELHFTLAALD